MCSPRQQDPDLTGHNGGQRHCAQRCDLAAEQDNEFMGRTNKQTTPFYRDKNDLLPEKHDTIGMYPHDTGAIQDCTLAGCSTHGFCACFFRWSSPAHAILPPEVSRMIPSLFPSDVIPVFAVRSLKSWSLSILISSFILRVKKITAIVLIDQGIARHLNT